MDIERFSSESNEDINHKNIVEILKIYESHPSVIKIKENISVENKFAFDLITPELIKKQLLHLKPNKASGKNDTVDSL